MFVIVWMFVFVQVSAICTSEYVTVVHRSRPLTWVQTSLACAQLLGLYGYTGSWSAWNGSFWQFSWLAFHLWSFCFFCWYFLYWFWIVDAALSAEAVCPLLDEESIKTWKIIDQIEHICVFFNVYFCTIVLIKVILTLSVNSYAVPSLAHKLQSK